MKKLPLSQRISSYRREKFCTPTYSVVTLYTNWLRRLTTTDFIMVQKINDVSTVIWSAYVMSRNPTPASDTTTSLPLWNIAELLKFDVVNGDMKDVPNTFVIDLAIPVGTCTPMDPPYVSLPYTREVAIEKENYNLAEPLPYAPDGVCHMITYGISELGG